MCFFFYLNILSFKEHLYVSTLQSFEVNEIIIWLIQWGLNFSDEHLLLTGRITEGKRNKTYSQILKARLKARSLKISAEGD